MADGATKRRLAIHAGMRWGAAGLLGAVVGVAAQRWLGWTTPGEFLKSHFADPLALLGGSLDGPTAEMLLAPLAGFVLGVGAAGLPAGRALLKRLLPAPPAFVRSGLAELRRQTMIHTNSAPVAFIGRDSVLRELTGMARGKRDPARWRAVVGPPGVGKSRLMIEWLVALRAEGWDVGVVDAGDTIPPDWRPRRPTALVFDDHRWSDRLGPALAILMAAGRSGAEVRVLVSDQIEPAADAAAIVGGTRVVPALTLDGLDDTSAQRLWQASGRQGDFDADHLGRETAFRPRALMLLARSDSADDYAGALANWAAELVPALAEVPGEHAEHADLDLIETLALSALAGPLETDFNLHKLRRFFPPGMARGRLPAFEPEELGREILLRGLEFLANAAASRPAAVIDRALAANPEAVDWTLGVLWRERPEAAAACAAYDQTPPPGLAGWLVTLQRHVDAALPDRVAAARDEAGMLAHQTAAPASRAALDCTLADLAAAADRRPFDHPIRLWEAFAAVNAVLHYGEAGRFADLERWGGRLVAAAAQYPDDRDIRLLEAKGAVNAIGQYGAADRLDDLERWGGCLTAAIARFPNDRDIRLEESKGVVAAIGHYGEARLFLELERWGARLAAVAAQFPDDRDIRQYEAGGAFNALNGYGRADKFPDLERWGWRLADIAAQYPHDRDICQHEAKGAVNAIDRYGAADKFDDLERWGGRLCALAAQHPDNRDICLIETVGAYNAVTTYGRAGHIPKLEHWGGRLAAVVAQYPDDPDFRRVEAMGAVGAIQCYDMPDQFPDLERWGARLVAAAAQFPDDPVIRQEEGKGAVNATHNYGKAGQSVDLERWGRRLCGLVTQFYDSRDIRLLAVKGAHNAINHFSEAGQSHQPDLQRWRKVLADAAWAFPADMAIQEIASQHCLSYADQAAAGRSKEPCLSG